MSNDANPSSDWELGPGWQGVQTGGGSAEYYYYYKRRKNQTKR